jgi:hypothetical protein
MSGIERLRAIRAKYATKKTQSNDADVPRGRTRRRASDNVESEASHATTKASTTYETRKHTKKPAIDGEEVLPATKKPMTREASKPKQCPDKELSDTRSFQDLVHEYGDDGE